MKGKAALLIGAAAGYVLGARAGRERYQEIMSKADQLWHDPKVQEKASQAQDMAKTAAQKTAGKAKDAKSKAGSSSDSSTSSSISSSSSGMSSGASSGTGTAPAPSGTPSTTLSSEPMPSQSTSPIAESARPTPSSTGAGGTAS
jgi:hypothetical protein